MKTQIEIFTFVKFKRTLCELNMSEKVIKEGWFRKKTYKGLGSGKRYYFVLNDLYLEWFVAPVCTIFYFMVF